MHLRHKYSVCCLCDSWRLKHMMMVVVSIRLFTYLCCLLSIIIPQARAQQTCSFLNATCADDRGYYTANSTYNLNLMTVLTNLTSNAKNDYGFYNSSYGHNADKVNALGMCRGDVKPDDCRRCLMDAMALLTQLCLNQKEAIGWHDNCMLRYSNRSIFGVVDTSPTFYLWNPSDAYEVDQYNQVVQNLTNRLRITAEVGDYRRKYATANVSGQRFQHIYGLAQCTPDLSGRQCDDCLVKAISEIPTCCNNKKGGRVLKPSCNIRYESYSFFGPTADAPLPSPSPSPVTSPLPSPVTNNTSSKGQGKGNTSRTAIAIAVPTAIVVLVPSIICLYLRMRKPKENSDGKRLSNLLGLLAKISVDNIFLSMYTTKKTL